MEIGSKMTDKSSPNSDHITHDIAQTRLQKSKTSPAPPPDENRFDTLPSNSIKSASPKTEAATASKSKAADTNMVVTSENYTKAYLEERAKLDQARAEELKKAAKELPNAAQAEAAKKQAEDMQRRHADDQRIRARELQNQIQWWQQQNGLGQYDDATVQWNVSNLEAQLNQISREFW